MPIASNNLSFTRPIPGTLRIERSCMNALMDWASNWSWNCPFGLFYTPLIRDVGTRSQVTKQTLSEHILERQSFEWTLRHKEMSTHLCEHLCEEERLGPFQRFLEKDPDLVRRNTCAHRQLWLLEDSFSHLLHTFFCSQRMLFAVSGDAGQSISNARAEKKNMKTIL